ncbi:uncharacterized protein LOC122625593 [Drosophila teissieri]|uniref:uncharacterized protein LOC122625593 n=1 Tax=Drosophila teissieri TaxID=7243 RepID=UPI001CBA0415|nr:uncharacterized protein LOC122625593 [Drosophila teissieri]
MPLVNVTSHQDRLGLPLLHELSLKNLHHIGAIKERFLLGPLVGYSLIELVLACVIWLSRLIWIANWRTDSKSGDDIEGGGRRDDDHLKEGRVSKRNEDFAKLPSCRPDGKARTGKTETAEYAVRGAVLHTLSDHAENKWPSSSGRKVADTAPN